ncbi:ABC transporter permease [Clostridium hydrogenum]|uniref:ABC transporter permease n=1 Tax=Clostridium hydrogenum TaxID=2855764 RepID=UPI001F1C301A|nr:FtsX-like permease family protein [Clostridium hydrogenum]
MWLKKLKKKKLQCFLIGMLLFISAMIFASGASIITSVNNYTDKYYANDKYYNIFTINANPGCENGVIKWCQNSTKIKEVKFLDNFSSGNNIYYNNKKLKISNYSLIPLENYKGVPYGLNKIKALNGSNHPGKGEIWITKLFADDNKISLGDSLKFKVNNKFINLKVTSLVNDSLQPSPMMGVIILYTSKENNKDFVSLAKGKSIFINTKRNADFLRLENSLADNAGISEVFDKTTLITSATYVASLMGGITSFAALLVFVAAVFIIRFIIWNNILKEYKSIGIYKALGFSKKQIFKFYILGYFFIVVAGSILGALSSIPILNHTAANALKYVGNFTSVDINFKIILLTIILFTLIVTLNLYFVIRRTNKISPVKAISTGITSSRKKLKKSLIKNSVSPLALGINDIFKYKKSAIYITISLMVSLSLMLLFGNLGMTFSKMKDNLNVWVGMPKSRMIISFDDTINKEKIEAVLNKIKKDKRVQNYNYGSILAGNVKLNTEKYHIKNSGYAVMALNSYDDNMKFSISNGHNPTSANEVSVSKEILQDSNLSVGDYIDLTVNNKKNTYLISGSFNSMMNNGYSMRILNHGIEKGKDAYNVYRIYVNLKGNYSTSKFEEDMKSKFSYISIDDIDPMGRSAINSISSITLPIVYLLVISFAIFSIIIIFNIIIMDIRDNRKNFGIMKALGFTTKEIRNRYLCRIIILTVFGSVISIILNLLFSRQIIEVMLNGLDGLMISWSIIEILSISMFILVLLIVFACSYSIKNAKPNELIDE